MFFVADVIIHLGVGVSGDIFTLKISNDCSHILTVYPASLPVSAFTMGIFPLS